MVDNGLRATRKTGLTFYAEEPKIILGAERRGEARMLSESRGKALEDRDPETDRCGEKGGEHEDDNDESGGVGI